MDAATQQQDEDDMDTDVVMDEKMLNKFKAHLQQQREKNVLQQRRAVPTTNNAANMSHSGGKLSVKPHGGLATHTKASFENVYVFTATQGRRSLR